MSEKSLISSIASPSKLSISSRDRSPKKCQFSPQLSNSQDQDSNTRLDKCTTWLCRRGAATELNENKGQSGENGTLHGPQSSPGPSTGGSSSICEDSQPPPKNCFRLVMLGSARVGKTSLVARFLGSKFDDSYTPTIEDFHRKLYRIRGEIFQLDILDTSGNHPFPAMRRLSFLTGDIFVLVFAMDSRESFEEVIRLREQILETKAGASANSTSRSKKAAPRVPMAIAGNKCDRDMRTVHPDEATSYCATQDGSCVFVETSAKKNYKVDDLFYELFFAANLPLEMAPNHHKRVSTAFGSPCALPPHAQTHKTKKCTLSIKRRLSDACGVVTPNVRRPSIRTDLMIMRTKTTCVGESESAGGSPKMNLNKLVRNSNNNSNSEHRSCTLQ